jgi:hypothetical protein
VRDERGLRLAGVEGRGSAYQNRKGGEDELRENLKHKKNKEGLLLNSNNEKFNGYS